MSISRRLATALVAATVAFGLNVAWMGLSFSNVDQAPIKIIMIPVTWLLNPPAVAIVAVELLGTSAFRSSMISIGQGDTEMDISLLLIGLPTVSACFWGAITWIIGRDFPRHAWHRGLD